jgi:hypothetical protein
MLVRSRALQLDIIVLQEISELHGMNIGIIIRLEDPERFGARIASRSKLMNHTLKTRKPLGLRFHMHDEDFI